MADNYLPGPDPIFFAPDLNTALEAESALGTALANNRGAGAAVSGVSPAQADTLMSWMVDNARNALVEKRAKRTGGSSYDEAFTAESVRGRCGLGQALCSLQAEMMGIDSQTHQVFKLSPEPGLSHVFSVMNLPVQTPDGVTQKSFLVDTTFRQFFTTEIDNFAGGGSQPGWGFQMVQTDEGKLMADALLTKGFVELTPERAALYIGSQSFAKKDDIATAVHAPPEPQTAFHQLVASSSTELDFDIGELADVDLRTPSLVAQQAPRSAIVDAHKQQTGVEPVRSLVRDTVERLPSKENRLAGELKQALASQMKPGSILGVRHEEGAYVVTVPADFSRSEFGKVGIPDPGSLVRSAAATQGHDITIPEGKLNHHYHIDAKAAPSSALEQARDVGRGPLAMAMSAAANTPPSHDSEPRIGTPPPRQR